MIVSKINILGVKLYLRLSLALETGPKINVRQGVWFSGLDERVITYCIKREHTVSLQQSGHD